jgi:hypothetical protein
MAGAIGSRKHTLPIPVSDKKKKMKIIGTLATFVQSYLKHNTKKVASVSFNIYSDLRGRFTCI